MPGMPHLGVPFLPEPLGISLLGSLGFPQFHMVSTWFPQVVRADTATLQSVDYNAACVEKTVKNVSTPWGWVGYSQGCANAFRAESMMLQAGCPFETAGGSWSMVGLGFMVLV